MRSPEMHRHRKSELVRSPPNSPGMDELHGWIICRQDANHISKVLRTTYKFRSQRGFVHITPTYKPNHIDSKVIIEMVRWCFAETLRVFWKGTDREQVAKAIRELLTFDVPCIGKFEEIIMVQRTDLTAEEELLVLLHYAGEQGFTRTELGKHAMLKAPAVTTALQKLTTPEVRQVVQLKSGKYRLTDLQQVAHTLEVVRSSVPVNCQQVHTQLVDWSGADAF